jgi:hypothetical protein
MARSGTKGGFARYGCAFLVFLIVVPWILSLLGDDPQPVKPQDEVILETATRYAKDLMSRRFRETFSGCGYNKIVSMNSAGATVEGVCHTVNYKNVFQDEHHYTMTLTRRGDAWRLETVKWK